MELRIGINKAMEYTFLNTKNGTIETHDMKMSEYDQFKLDNPHLERYHDSAPSFLYDGMTTNIDAKTDNTWKEVLSKISEKHPASELASSYGNKSNKEVKTKNILDKHIKKTQAGG